MNASQQQVINDLCNDGYAVIIWTPEELGNADPRKVEDRSIELTWDVIDALGGPSLDEQLESIDQ